MAEHHVLMGGKLHIYKRENSQHWQASTYLAGKNWRKSTKEESLSHARGKARGGELKTGKTFRQATKHFLAEYLALVAPERNPQYMKDCQMRLRAHLLPFFGRTARVVLLHQPTPRLPRTSISRIVSWLPASLTILMSLNSSRAASSGLSPVFAMKRT
jgi:hypothetical protein